MSHPECEKLNERTKEWNAIYPFMFAFREAPPHTNRLRAIVTKTPVRWRCYHEIDAVRRPPSHDFGAVTEHHLVEGYGHSPFSSLNSGSILSCTSSLVRL